MIHLEIPGLTYAMSDEEKTIQIGKAVTECQEAKINLAEVEHRVKRVAEAYKEAARSFETPPPSAEPQVVDGRVEFLYLRDKGIADFLMNGAELAELLKERDSARSRVEAAAHLLTSLGITTLH